MTTQIIPERQKLQFLDGLRGLAAIYVMIGHARWLLWEGYAQYQAHPEQYSTLNKMATYFFSLFRYGHEVVLFFFVLSGFVIHLKYARNYSQQKPTIFRYREYLVKRIRRIYPPFIFALILTFILDRCGMILGFPIYNGSSPYSLINDNLANPDLSIVALLGNLSFVFENYLPLFGTNGPAWSLKYEWWFYMLYPIFLLIGTKRILYPTLLIIVLFILSFFPTLWPEKLLPDIFSMMITWWFGVLLAEIYVGRIKFKFQYVAWCGIAILAFLLPFTVPKIMSDVVMALFFFGVIALLLSLDVSNQIVRRLAAMKLLGDFSYTLYITHFPIIVFMSGWVMKVNGGLLPANFLYVVAGIVVTLMTAYIFHFFTELPFIRVKNHNNRGVLKLPS
ncbi:MAG: acyltransferase [Chitinophagaceae bacterium]|nr:MAG: acyltransferase [Chitinophagaceae bacterium]